MKKCLSELIKESKSIETEIAYVLKCEMDSAHYTYEKGKKPEFLPKYSYEVTSNYLKDLYQRQKEVKSVILKANANTNVIGYEISISEALVYLAQLSANVKRLSTLASYQEYKEEIDGYGENRATYVTCINYNLEQVKTDLKEYQNELSKLQIAIDKTNILTEVEI